MKKPRDLPIKTCPFGCGGKIELKQEFQKFISHGNIYKGNRWLYECAGCGLGFTTTESDTISMENLRKGQ